MNKTKLVSVESPYNAYTPWNQLRNIQYAILANTHAASKEDATWTPHICNTQYVKFGFNSYIGDTYGTMMLKFFGKDFYKYSIGLKRTMEVTNDIRRSKVDKVICYTDFGISRGMQSAIDTAKEVGIEVEERKLPKDLMKDVYGQSFSSTFFPTAKFGVSSGLMLYGAYNLLKKLKR